MAKWTNRLRGALGGGKGDDKAPDEQPEDDQTSRTGQRGKGLVARTRERIEEYKEPLGLLQQFAEEALKRLNQEDPKKYDKASMLDFAELKMSKNRIEIRVPGQDEARALTNIAKQALGSPEYRAIERQERSQIRNGKLTYILRININDNTAEKCTEMLEKCLRQIGVEPDWKANYQETDHAAEAEFRKQVADEERDDGRGGRF